jgi:lipopolysaccharide/colanic/teichoic acid biosynthesis glycosyltransferase
VIDTLGGDGVPVVSLPEIRLPDENVRRQVVSQLRPLMYCICCTPKILLWVDVGGVTLRNGDAMNFPAPLGFANRSVGLPARWEPAARRIVDLLVVSVALLVLAIPMLFVAMAIRLGTQGPALYRQQRVGRGGRPFTMYKFRTMRVGGSDAQHRELIARELRGEDTSVGGSWKLDSDPRVTRIGSFLRRTSADELPQLLNVLLGQMALVGPRPCLEWEAEMFPRKYAERFDVMPGLTGLWQVSGRSTMGTMEMLELDLAYARSWSFWTDLTILVRTVPTLLRGHGAR